jgi:hypothetical protein
VKRRFEGDRERRRGPSLTVGASRSWSGSGEEERERDMVVAAGVRRGAGTTRFEA